MAPTPWRWASRWMSHDAPRVRRGNRRRRAPLGVAVWKTLAHVSLGLILAGCASSKTAVAGKPASSSGFASWFKAPSSGKAPKPPKIKSAEQAIVVLQESKDADYRVQAYHKLNKADRLSVADRAEAQRLLLEGSQNETTPLARTAAIQSLKAFNGPEALDALRESANDRNPLVRAEACKALGELKDPGSMEMMGRLAINDTSIDVRHRAAEALVAMNDPQANTYLSQCLLDQDYAIVNIAAKGLRENTKQDLGTSPEAWAHYLREGSTDPNYRKPETKPATMWARLMGRGGDTLVMPTNAMVAKPNESDAEAKPAVATAPLKQDTASASGSFKAPAEVVKKEPAPPVKVTKTPGEVGPLTSSKPLSISTKPAARSTEKAPPANDAAEEEVGAVVTPPIQISRPMSRNPDSRK